MLGRNLRVEDVATLSPAPFVSYWPSWAALWASEREQSPGPDGTDGCTETSLINSGKKRPVLFIGCLSNFQMKIKVCVTVSSQHRPKISVIPRKTAVGPWLWWTDVSKLVHLVTNIRRDDLGSPPTGLCDSQCQRLLHAGISSESSEGPGAPQRSEGSRQEEETRRGGFGRVLACLFPWQQTCLCLSLFEQSLSV